MLVEVDNNALYIDANSLLVYRPNQTLKILDIASGTTGAFVLFTRKFVDYLFESFFSIAPHSFLRSQFGSHITLSRTDHNKISSLFSQTIRFLDNSETKTERWTYSAKCILLALINETDFVLNKYKLDKYDTNRREIEISNSFKNFVAQNYINERNIDFYAKNLNISSNYLHKVIKRRYGQTPIEIINNALLSECKSRLSYSDSSIGEIADDMGFESIQSFSKYFKKHTGTSPSLYRNDTLSLNNP
ncbi:MULTISPECIES: helix-turn-helix domain-containing protein [Bacteroidota]|nr:MULTISPECIES: helix-turn-helix transcriptional regulator [Bacteroidota]QQY29795.1 AraC family transcriptional regulator [Chryseobacterium gleum]